MKIEAQKSYYLRRAISRFGQIEIPPNISDIRKLSKVLKRLAKLFKGDDQYALIRTELVLKMRKRDYVGVLDILRRHEPDLKKIGHGLLRRAKAASAALATRNVILSSTRSAEISAWSKHGGIKDTRLILASWTPHRELLDELSRDGNPAVRRTVALNAYSPDGLLKKLAEDPVCDVRRAVAENPNTPHEILANLSLCLNFDLMRNPTVAKLVDQCKNSINPDELLHFARNPIRLIREAVAENPNTSPQALLVGLSADDRRSIRAKAISNPNFPADKLTELSEKKEESIREAVARNPKAPQDVLSKLARDESVGVKEAVAGNPNTPLETIKELVKDRAWIIRRAIYNNPNTPSDIREKATYTFIEIGTASIEASLSPEFPASPEIIADILVKDSEFMRLLFDAASRPGGSIDIEVLAGGHKKEEKPIVEKVEVGSADTKECFHDYGGSAIKGAEAGVWYPPGPPPVKERVIGHETEEHLTSFSVRANFLSGVRTYECRIQVDRADGDLIGLSNTDVIDFYRKLFSRLTVEEYAKIVKELCVTIEKTEVPEHRKTETLERGTGRGTSDSRENFFYEETTTVTEEVLVPADVKEEPRIDKDKLRILLSFRPESEREKILQASGLSL